MTARLRRLDRLFAERVLGKPEVLEVPYDGSKPDFFITEPNNRLVPLPAYTRSLDAAWEGMVKIGRIFDLTYQVMDEDDHDEGDPPIPPCTARFEMPPMPVFENGKLFLREDDSQSECCDHPAEALVLACLRAVGVTEEEMG